MKSISSTIILSLAFLALGCGGSNSGESPTEVTDSTPPNGKLTESEKTEALSLFTELDNINSLTYYFEDESSSEDPSQDPSEESPTQLPDYVSQLLSFCDYRVQEVQLPNTEFTYENTFIDGNCPFHQSNVNSNVSTKLSSNGVIINANNTIKFNMQDNTLSEFTRVQNFNLKGALRFAYQFDESTQNVQKSSSTAKASYNGQITLTGYGKLPAYIRASSHNKSKYNAETGEDTFIDKSTVKFGVKVNNKWNQLKIVNIQTQDNLNTEIYINDELVNPGENQIEGLKSISILRNLPFN